MYDTGMDQKLEKNGVVLVSGMESGMGTNLKRIPRLPLEYTPLAQRTPAVRQCAAARLHPPAARTLAAALP
jgi:hypothetical protein